MKKFERYVTLVKPHENTRPIWCFFGIENTKT